MSPSLHTTGFPPLKVICRLIRSRASAMVCSKHSASSDLYQGDANIPLITTKKRRDLRCSPAQFQEPSLNPELRMIHRPGAHPKKTRFLQIFQTGVEDGSNAIL